MTSQFSFMVSHLSLLAVRGGLVVGTNNMNKFLQKYAHTYDNYNEMPTVQFSI